VINPLYESMKIIVTKSYLFNAVKERALRNRNQFQSTHKREGTKIQMGNNK